MIGELLENSLRLGKEFEFLRAEGKRCVFGKGVYELGNSFKNWEGVECRKKNREISGGVEGLEKTLKDLPFAKALTGLGRR